MRVRLILAGFGILFLFATGCYNGEQLPDQIGQLSSPAIYLAGENKADNSKLISINIPIQGIKVYYTTDESEPSDKNGSLYEGPFKIYKTTTIKGIAMKTGWGKSPVVERTFIIEIIEDSQTTQDSTASTTDTNTTVNTTETTTPSESTTSTTETTAADTTTVASTSTTATDSTTVSSTGTTESTTADTSNNGTTTTTAVSSTNTGANNGSSTTASNNSNTGSNNASSSSNTTNGSTTSASSSSNTSTASTTASNNSNTGSNNASSSSNATNGSATSTTASSSSNGSSTSTTASNNSNAGSNNGNGTTTTTSTSSTQETVTEEMVTTVEEQTVVTGGDLINESDIETPAEEAESTIIENATVEEDANTSETTADEEVVETTGKGKEKKEKIKFGFSIKVKKTKISKDQIEITWVITNKGTEPIKAVKSYIENAESDIQVPSIFQPGQRTFTVVTSKTGDLKWVIEVVNPNGKKIVKKSGVKVTGSKFSIKVKAVSVVSENGKALVTWSVTNKGKTTVTASKAYYTTNEKTKPLTVFNPGTTTFTLETNTVGKIGLIVEAVNPKGKTVKKQASVNIKVKKEKTVKTKKVKTKKDKNGKKTVVEETPVSTTKTTVDTSNGNGKSNGKNK
ncbi:MAG: hypothetical protein A2Y41_08635 [Spirochaetes bacterium GWB1_36_13]|nr:MAG: hypothetical protein A2Y41_08635 [Spirochaetes bacterium GWB1_36_13]